MRQHPEHEVSTGRVVANDDIGRQSVSRLEDIAQCFQTLTQLVGILGVRS